MAATYNIDGFTGGSYFEISSNPANGSASINAASGLWSYDSNDDYNGSDAFTVTITDDDGNTEAQIISLTINPVNDAPTITSNTAAATGAITEDNATTATGTIIAADVDMGDAPTYSVGANDGTYGTLTLGTAGAWTYTIDNTNATVQALAQGVTLTDTVAVTVSDGNGGSVTQDVVVTIEGANDAAIITVADPVDIFEGETKTDVTISGTATHTDIDTNNNNDIFRSVAVNTDSTLGYGTYDVSTSGAWTYVLDSKNTTIDALGAGKSTTVTITVTAEDGTT